MRKFMDLSRQKIGRLLVIKRADNNKHGNVQFECKCDCGKTIIVAASHLRNGNTRSCGCLKSEYVSDKNRTHNLSKTRLYGVWGALVQRCRNPRNADYHLYGGRGITLCDEWLDFENFHRWALDQGYNENAEYGSMTIDRIDVNRGYCPENCRFANAIEQANNKRTNRKFLFDNEYLTIAQIAGCLNVPYHRLYRAMKRNNWMIPEGKI